MLVNPARSACNFEVITSLFGRKNSNMSLFQTFNSMNILPYAGLKGLFTQITKYIISLWDFCLPSQYNWGEWSFVSGFSVIKNVSV